MHVCARGLWNGDPELPGAHGGGRGLPPRLAARRGLTCLSPQRGPRPAAPPPAAQEASGGRPAPGPASNRAQRGRDWLRAGEPGGAAPMARGGGERGSACLWYLLRGA